MDEKVNRDIERLEEDIEKLWHALGTFKEKFNSFELSDAKVDGELRLKIANIENSILTLRQEIRLELKAALEPIVTSVSVLQTKGAVVGSVVGSVITTMIAGFIGLVFYLIRGGIQ